LNIDYDFTKLGLQCSKVELFLRQCRTFTQRIKFWVHRTDVIFINRSWLFY